VRQKPITRYMVKKGSQHTMKTPTAVMPSVQAASVTIRNRFTRALMFPIGLDANLDHRRSHRQSNRRTTVTAKVVLWLTWWNRTLFPRQWWWWWCPPGDDVNRRWRRRSWCSFRLPPQLTIGRAGHWPVVVRARIADADLEPLVV